MSISARPIAYSRVNSPIGPVYVAHDGYEAVAVRPAGDPARFESWLVDHVGASRRQTALPGPILEALSAAVSGRADRRPSLSGQEGPRRLVLSKTFDIPRGQVRTY